MNKSGFFLELVDIENNNTNVNIEFNNYKNALFIHVLSVDKLNNITKKGNYNKIHKKHISLKRIEKVYNDLKQLNKINDIKEYFNNNLKVVKI